MLGAFANEGRRVLRKLLVVPLLVSAVPWVGHARQNTGAGLDDLSKRVSELSALVERLQARLDLLEGKSAAPSQPAVSAATAAPSPEPAPPPSAAAPPLTTAAVPAGFWSGTTFNASFDAYYAFNFNNPIGRVNLLRALDISSNAFSLNQADVVIENAPDPAHDKRLGLRLDLQFGQATAAMQAMLRMNRGLTSTGISSRRTAPMSYRSVPVLPWISANGPALWAWKATIRRIR